MKLTVSDTMIHASDVPSSHFDARLTVAPLHLRPILWAVRDHRIGWGTVPQHVGRFDLPTSKPNVVVIGDDLEEALGPAAFHRKSVRRQAERSVFAAVVACEPLVEVYERAVHLAIVTRRDTLIVESRPRFEADWYDLLRKANPNLEVIVATVMPEGTA